MSSFLNSSCLNMFLMLCFLSVMTEIYFLKLKGSHFVFSTSGYLIISEYHQYNISGMSVAESVCVTVGSLFPTSLEPKICYMSLAVHKLCLLLPGLSRHIGRLVGAIDVFCCHLVALSYSLKVTKAVEKWQWKQYSSTPPSLATSFKLSTIGTRAFPVAGPRVWNSLPADIISASFLSTFRQRLKTWIFQQSFPHLTV